MIGKKLLSMSNGYLQTRMEFGKTDETSEADEADKTDETYEANESSEKNNNDYKNGNSSNNKAIPQSITLSELISSKLNISREEYLLSKKSAIDNTLRNIRSMMAFNENGEFLFIYLPTKYGYKAQQFNIEKRYKYNLLKQGSRKLCRD